MAPRMVTMSVNTEELTVAARVLHCVSGVARLSDAEIAEKAGWSRQTVHAKRTGTSEISHADTIVLAHVFGLEPDHFLRSPLEACMEYLRRNSAHFKCSEPYDGVSSKASNPGRSEAA